MLFRDGLLDSTAVTNSFALPSTSIPDDLLRTKLTPPRLHSALLARPALLARLDEGLSRRLTVISAPAGSGKTTLAAGWLAERGVATAWVALDAGDNDPIRFWRYVMTACRAFDPTVGTSGLAALRTAQQPSLESVLTSFINDLAQLTGQAYLLVLEDYQAITAPDVWRGVAFLLDHLPSTLHLLVLTRAEPALPLARLRIQNELTELTGADLRFSAEEARDFLQQALSVTLSPESVARLEQRTEGWVAGLRLVALALQNRTDAVAAEQFLTSFSGEHRHVFEYLIGEVLAAQTPSTQEFLLLTSFLSRLSGLLCDAVTGRGDGAVMLETLERANLFLIPLGSSEGMGWYRYHNLFAEAMRHHAARQLGDARMKALRDQAGRWYEAQGLLNDAVDEAIAASQSERAIELIERIVDQRGTNELYTLMHWLEQLPKSDIEHHPTLCFVYAFGLMYGSPATARTAIDETNQWIERADAGWRRAEDEAQLGRVFALRAGYWWARGELAFSVAAARQALELLAPHDIDWRGISLITVGVHELWSGRIDNAESILLETRALCEAAQNIYTQLVSTYYLGQTYYQQAALDQAVLLYQQMLTDAVGNESLADDRASAFDGLSVVSYERDDLAAAETQAQEALSLSRSRGDENRQVGPMLTLARVAQARGQVDEARQLARAASLRPVPVYTQREAQALMAWFALQNGDLAAVEHWANRLDSQPVPALQHERETLVIARLRLAQGQPQSALDLLGPWLADARAQGRRRGELEILCLSALAYVALGDASLAAQTLTDALVLAQPHGFRRVFVDEGQPMAALLRAVAPKVERRLAAYVTALLRAFTPGASEVSGMAALVESLSPQELRVLRLIVAGLSNPEIADELVVSNNTVKTHVKNVYRKLNVGSRDEAQDVARELKLL